MKRKHNGDDQTTRKTQALHVSWLKLDKTLGTLIVIRVPRQSSQSTNY